MLSAQIFYIAQHLAFVLLKIRRSELLLSTVVIGIGVAAYLQKSDGYDILAYTQAMHYPTIFEPGFALLCQVASSFFPDYRTALLVVQIVLVLFFLTLPFFAGLRGTRLVLGLAIVFASVSFTLGVNNGLRQAFASVLILGAVFQVMKRRWVWGIALALLSQTFHSSSVAFLGVLLLFGFLAGSTLTSGFGDKSKRLSLPAILLVLSGTAVLAILAMNVAFGLGFYSSYQTRDLVVVGERVGSVIKLVALGGTLVLSEWAFGRLEARRDAFNFLRYFRLGFFCLLLALAFNSDYNEAFSRVMYFYFSVELGVVLAAVKERKFNGATIVMLSYAVAINAINMFGRTA